MDATPTKSPVLSSVLPKTNPYAAVVADESQVPWWQTVFAQAMLGAVLVWLAFPPVGLWPLGWLGTIPWIVLARRDNLPGKRPYLMLYLAGLVHWLLMTQWVRLPHWAANFGWLLLASYLAVYVPLFIGLSRVAIHRWKLPAWLAAPIVWTGLELVRAYLFTGYGISLLAHSQVRQTVLIQISDLAGGYGLAFVLLLVAAALSYFVPASMVSPGKASGNHIKTVLSKTLLPMSIALAALAATIGYGIYRLNEELPARLGAQPPPRIALIQGSIDTLFDGNLDQAEETYRQYLSLSREAVKAEPKPDLLIWPETVFAHELVTVDPSVVLSLRRGDMQAMLPAQASASGPKLVANAEFDEAVVKDIRKFLDKAEDDARFALRSTPAIIGTQAVHVQVEQVPGQQPKLVPRQYNAAVQLSGTGQILARYDKQHPVMFGEYVPFGDVFPWLYSLTPLPGGLTPGAEPRVFHASGLKMSPSICFESTVPHLIRNQVLWGVGQGEEPDVLLNLTNDGWFWGSSLLDLQLACGAFRAVELRKPMLVAANTGFSAWIDGNGQILAQGPRRDTGIVWATPTPDGRGSFYLQYGDWFASGCAMVCGVLLLQGIAIGVGQRWKKRKLAPGQ